MTALDHIAAAVVHLAEARAELEREREETGLHSCPPRLYQVKAALTALGQAR